MFQANKFEVRFAVKKQVFKASLQFDKQSVTRLEKSQIGKFVLSYNL